MTSQPLIHPTAIIEEGARLGEGVTIGPFCLVGPNVTLEAGVRLHNHVTVTGNTHMAERVEVYPQAVIGGPAQFVSMKPGPSRLEIGADTILREHVTIHAGSPAHSQVTRVGRNCFLMINTHIAHDCLVSDKCVFANNVSLAGHVEVGEQVWIGGHAAVHQFTRIGAHAFIAGGAMVVADVLPYGVISFEHPHLAGLNVNGLKRRGFTRAQMHTIRSVYKAVFEADGPIADRLNTVRASHGQTPEGALILDFIAANAKRPLCKPPL